MTKEQVKKILDRVLTWPPERQAEVEDFVDFLNVRDEYRRLTRIAARLSEDAFRQVWENDADSAYDQL